MIAVLDYDAGNATSVVRALAHVGAQAVITADPAVVARAERVVFPGVGAAAASMAALKARGLDQALRAALARGTPILCVCIGLQLLFERSDEDGGVECLGILPGRVVRFPTRPGLKVPHMGWSELELAPDPLLEGLPDRWFYFVHSYYPAPGPGVQVIARADYGMPFCAGVRMGSLAAFQCHVEKSGRAGLALLRNFATSA
jgi:glutamine amidotransferase